MIDVGSAMALVGSLKTAGEITQAIIGLRDTAMIQKKVIELNGIILSAQTNAMSANLNQTALQEKIRSLETELARLNEWDAEKNKYKLTEVGTGAFVYAPRPESDIAEPPHWLCTKCFGRKERSFMQYQGRTSNKNDSIYKCGTCHLQFQAPYTRTPSSVAEKEAQKGMKPPGHPCPKCGKNELRLLEAIPHPTMSEMSVMLHRFSCECGFKTERAVTD